MAETASLIKPGSSSSSNAAAQLTVSLGSRSFTLSADDLAKHPDSLLAGVAAEGSSSLNLADVEVLNPLTDWPEAFAIIPMLYRGGGIPVNFLDQQLDQLYGTKTDAMAAIDALYAKLEHLLSFLDLSGAPVLSWIRWETCTPKQSKVLRFSLKCIAQPAVDAMVDYTPFRNESKCSTAGLVRMYAAFVVAAESGITAPLSVYAVDTASLGSVDTELARLPELPDLWAGGMQSTVTSRKLPCSNLGDQWSSLIEVTALSGGGNKQNMLFADVQDCCISMDNPVVGKHLVQSMIAAAANKPFVFDYAAAAVSVWCSRTERTYTVPLWVMRW